MERENREGYKDQIITCDVGVSASSTAHVYSTVMAQVHIVVHT